MSNRTGRQGVSRDREPAEAQPSTNKKRTRRFLVRLVLAAVGLLVIGLAIKEFRVRGTEGVTAITVADYAAAAEVQAKPAPGFTLPSLSGHGTVSLSSYRGSVVVLNFWATWCSPCRREAPGLQRTWEAYQERGVRFLGVDERDNDPAGRAFVREFSITYPSGSDPAGQLANDYGLIGMPTTFVIDGAGTIRYRFIGYVTGDALQGAIDPLIKAEAPA